MTRAQGRARFGASFDEVPLQAAPEGPTDEAPARAERAAPEAARAEVFEI